jgi:hypothetical protein
MTPLAQSRGRRTAAGAVAGELGSRNQNWRDEAPVILPASSSIPGATEKHRLSHRRQAVESGPREAGEAGKKARRGATQSYTRVGKFALIQHQRYANAKQFKRANRALRKLKTYLGRVIRDIARKIDGDPGLETAFADLLSLARRVRAQERGQRGPKI